MSPRAPMFKARDVLRILQRLGFKPIRIKGSHFFLRHPDGRSTVVPVHAGEDIGRGLLRTIVREAQIPLEELLKDDD